MMAMLPCHRVLRLEFETARQLRVTNALLTLAMLIGMASFVALLVLRNAVVSGLPSYLLHVGLERVITSETTCTLQDDKFFFTNNALEYMNIVAAAISVFALCRRHGGVHASVCHMPEEGHALVGPVVLYLRSAV